MDNGEALNAPMFGNGGFYDHKHRLREGNSESKSPSYGSNSPIFQKYWTTTARVVELRSSHQQTDVLVL